MCSVSEREIPLNITSVPIFEKSPDNTSLSTQALNEIAGITTTEGNVDGYDIRINPYFN